jgi:hypothetical protein
MKFTTNSNQINVKTKAVSIETAFVFYKTLKIFRDKFCTKTLTIVTILELKRVLNN